MHTHTTTTIFPSRLPTFRHLPRTTGQASHRRVIAVATTVVAYRGGRPSVLCYYRAAALGRDIVRGNGGDANTRARGTSSPGSMGLCTVNQFFPLYSAPASAPPLHTRIYVYTIIIIIIIICSAGRHTHTNAGPNVPDTYVHMK